MSNGHGEDNVCSFHVARFNRISDPAAHEAITALDAAREWIKTLDQSPNHIIVMIGTDLPDGCSGTKFFRQEVFGTTRNRA